MKNIYNTYPFKPIFSIVGYCFIIISVASGIIFLWRIVGESASAKLNRLGMIFELLGILSIIPELLGQNRVTKFDEKIPSLKNTFVSINKNISQMLDGNIYFILDYISENPLTINIDGTGPIFFIANLLASCLLTYNLFTATLSQKVDPFVRGMEYVLGISGIIWFLYVAARFVFMRKNIEIDRLNLIQFFGLLVIAFAQLIVAIFSLPFLFSISLFVKAFLLLSVQLLRLSFSQMIALVTLPFIIFGNLMQLVSTYL